MTASHPLGTPLVVPIKRRPKTEPALSFDGLRAAGMAHIQALCGNTWTDHNLHDPGITMLEALCYGLSELAYRAEFPVADYLSGKQGEIDLQRQSLHPPEEIFPCRPTTLADLRRVLIDALGGHGSVSIDTDLSQGIHHLGMHGPCVDRALWPGYRDDVRRRFWRSRNLCEDMADEIADVMAVPVELRGEIEVESSCDPVHLLAEIYHRCERYIDAPVSFYSLDEALSAGLALDEIFDGPVLENGFITDADMAMQDRDTLFVGELTDEVRNASGVYGIRSLVLQRIDATEAQKPASGSLRWRWSDEGRRQALQLRVPQSGDLVCSLTVVRRGSIVPVSPNDVLVKIKEMRAAARTLNQRDKDGDAGGSRPHGVYRDVSAYYSIQHHFPAVYGINAHGLPSHASPQRHAQARQLKAYLMLFEQAMAHGGMQLQHLRDLFSADESSQRTYWWHMLDEAAMPDIESLYARDPDLIEQEVYTPLDHYTERKSRVLDHLLALLGQTCPQRSLRQFADFYSPHELDRALLDNKIAFLHEVLAFSRHRAAGFDYSMPFEGNPANRSGLERRVRLLLDFKERASPWLASDDVVRRRRLAPAPLRAARRLGRDVQPHSWSRLLAASASPEATTKPAAETVGSEVADELLRAGVFVNRYWWNQPAGQSGEVIVGPDSSGDYWSLGKAARREDGVQLAASVRQWLLDRDLHSEGMHVVEHLLLRPVGDAGSGTHAVDAFTVSVTFPDWTVRSHQPGFRLFVHETVEMNCPAHVHARCLWLDFMSMREFERRYQRWLNAKREYCGTPSQGSMAVNAAATDLAEWLESHRPKDESGAS